MKTFILTALTLTLISCGTSNKGKDPQPQPLKGEWELLAGQAGIYLELDGEKYQTITAVITGTQTIDYEKETGSYKNTDNTITFTPDYHTCGLPQPATWTYSKAGTTLNISLGNTTYVLPQAKPGNSEIDGYILTEKCL